MSDDSDDEVFGLNMSTLADAMSKANKEDEAVEEEALAKSAALRDVYDCFLRDLTSTDSKKLIALFQSLEEQFQIDLKFLDNSFAALQSGNYPTLFSTSHAVELFRSHETTGSLSQLEELRSRVLAYLVEGSEDVMVFRALEILSIGIAAFNLFLQVNYTGPELSEDEIPLVPLFTKVTATGDAKPDKMVSTTLLSVDGEFPYGGSDATCYLVIARVLLGLVADPTIPLWTSPVPIRDVKESSPAFAASVQGGDIWKCCSWDDRERSKVPLSLVLACKELKGYSCWWSARAIVTHQRLFIAGATSNTLWTEFLHNFKQVLLHHCGAVEPKVFLNINEASPLASEVWLEFGLAMFHFEKNDEGKSSFEAARKAASLHVEMTGALGKRTKFQQRSIAQMILKASSIPIESSEPNAAEETEVKEKSADAVVNVPHTEGQVDDSILLERTEYDEKEDKLESVEALVGEQLAVLLALCLDVKNSNPKDGLTTEEMRPYVERVLVHPYNWTIYSTGLLQRAWLDFESTYARDRATLQLQALVDQHGQTLTYTQLSKDVIEASAPVGERLRYLHSVVYPPRWELKKDLAQRYQELGILVSASELFMSLELWDDVVDCYSRMGKRKDALAVVQEQRDKGVAPTPRMLCSIGDLLKAPESTQHYEEAWTLSNGRYAKAMRNAGREAVQLADKSLSKESSVRSKLADPSQSAQESVTEEMAQRYAAEATKYLEYAESCLGKALTVQPSVTSDWFVLGTVRMRLMKWQESLTCFSTVVSHAPDAGDAWGNVGAIHMKLKRPDLALAAFTEGLKASRESWRMWENKLISGLQIKPVPPAPELVFTANELLDLQQRNIGRGVDTQLLAAVVSSVFRHEGIDVSAAEKGKPAPALPIKDEPLTSEYFSSQRVIRKTGELLERATGSTAKATDAKAWELLAIFNVAIGRRAASRACRMRHCRQLQVPGWEKRVEDMAAVAEAVVDLAEVYALPLGEPEVSPEEAKKAEQNDLYSVNSFVRGIIGRANALGASGDAAREKMNSAKAKIEHLVSAASS